MLESSKGLDKNLLTDRVVIHTFPFRHRLFYLLTVTYLLTYLPNYLITYLLTAYLQIYSCVRASASSIRQYYTSVALGY